MKSSPDKAPLTDETRAALGITPTADTRQGTRGPQRGAQAAKTMVEEHWFVHVLLKDGTTFKIGRDEEGAKALARSLKKQGVDAKAVAEQHRWVP